MRPSYEVRVKDISEACAKTMSETSRELCWQARCTDHSSRHHRFGQERHTGRRQMGTHMTCSSSIITRAKTGDQIKSWRDSSQCIQYNDCFKFVVGSAVHPALQCCCLIVGLSNHPYPWTPLECHPAICEEALASGCNVLPENTCVESSLKHEFQGG